MHSEPNTIKQSKGELGIERQQFHIWHRYYWWEYSFSKNPVWRYVSKILEMCKSFDPAITVQELYPKEIIQKVSKDVCKGCLITVLNVIKN